MADSQERVLAALRGERVNPVPVGAVTQSATLAQMEATGAFWPDAHRDALKMADLAAAAKTLLGFDLVRVPFDQTIEAELLGAKVSFGDAGANCAVVDHPLSLDDGVPEPPNLGTGRAEKVVEAISILRRRFGDAAAVIGGLVGPFTLAGQIVGMQPLLMSSLLDPAKVRPFLDFAVQVGIEYARRQVEAGADAICVEDMAASLDLVSPKIYEKLILEAQKKLVAAIEAPVILHICGGNTKILDLLVRTGAALSLDMRTDLAAAVKKSKGAVIGGIPPVEALLNGSAEQVRCAADLSLAAGVHILAPGCGIPPKTPTENLLEMARVARKGRS